MAEFKTLEQADKETMLAKQRELARSLQIVNQATEQEKKLSELKQLHREKIKEYSQSMLTKIDETKSEVVFNGYKIQFRKEARTSIDRKGLEANNPEIFNKYLVKKELDIMYIKPLKE